MRTGRAKFRLSELVPGDIVRVSAGDMIPADIRLLSSKDLFIIQASLTGESLPVEKFDAREPVPPASPLEGKNICFLGTSVESGTATGVVVGTGGRTYLGGLAKAIVGQRVQTSFDKGVARFTWLMIRFMAVMVPLVFLINGLTKHNWHEAFFFALAVAVGMTPEMLPMIVTVCLSKGAIAMARKKVIVKRLNSIQNLGAMDVLCTDKTGTLTMDRVVLERHCDVELEEDDEVLMLAYLNSHFQTGLRNVLDRAVLAHKEEIHDQFHVPEHRKTGRDPVRLRAPVDVGGGGNARGAAATHLQGRAGGDVSALHPVRVPGRDHAHGTSAHRGSEGRIPASVERRLSRAGGRLPRP